MNDDAAAPINTVSVFPEHGAHSIMFSTETITPQDLGRGWYMSTEKKSGTPDGWVFTTFRGMSAWGDCKKMKAAGGGSQGHPITDCKLPGWAIDFKKKHGLFEFMRWQKNSGIPMKQIGQAYPGLIIGGAVIGTLAIVLMSVLVVKLIKKKREPVA